MKNFRMFAFDLGSGYHSTNWEFQLVEGLLMKRSTTKHAWIVAGNPSAAMIIQSQHEQLADKRELVKVKEAAAQLLKEVEKLDGGTLGLHSATDDLRSRLGELE